MKAALFLLVIISCGGCASIVKERANFQPIEKMETVRLTHPIHLSLDTGYGRIINANSTWQSVGNISTNKVPRGLVWKPIGDILSIEGTQQYEAYLVVSNGMIVGFYLPASARFSPLTKQVEFP